MRIYACPFPFAFYSRLHCQRQDYNAGGVRYNSSYLQGVGLGSITDNLAAIYQWVLKKKQLEWMLCSSHAKNYVGHESLRHKLI